MCNGIATSLDKLGMILRRAQYERVANFHNFEKALREQRSLTLTHFNLSLRGSTAAHGEPVEPRGNLDEVEHTSANRRRYGDEIAALRSQ